MVPDVLVHHREYLKHLWAKTAKSGGGFVGFARGPPISVRRGPPILIQVEGVVSSLNGVGSLVWSQLSRLCNGRAGILEIRRSLSCVIVGVCEVREDDSRDE